MLPSTTATTSRSHRGGAGPKQRRGGLRNPNTSAHPGTNNSSPAGSDDDSSRKLRKVHFNTENNARGDSGSRAGRAASGRAASATKPKARALADIKSHIGANSSTGRTQTSASTSTALQTYEERFNSLKERRPHEKAEAIRNGTYQDPEKPVSLADAITIVGECQDMCPEYERVRRVREMDIWPEEATPETAHLPNSKRLPIEEKMVKKFVRSAAGMEEQLPSDLRPPHILKATLDYLINDIVAQKALGKVHHFVWDRTRCIRNDFSIQQVTHMEDVHLAMDCFERIARFHIVSSHHLRDPQNRGDRFDTQQEREQLDKTLLSLFQYYEDNESRFHSPNEPEFRAYQIVFELKSLRNNIEERLAKWDPRLADSARIQACMALHRAACVFEEPLGPGSFDAAALQATEQRYLDFWKLLASDRITFAEACIAEFSFNALRSRGFRYLWRANRRALKYGQQRVITLESLGPLLGFDSAEDTREWVQLTGVDVNQDGVISMNVAGGPKPAEGDFLRCSGLVQSKRRAKSLPQIINNVDEQESLFVPESAPSSTPMFNPRAASFTPSTTSIPPAAQAAPFAANGNPSKNSTWTPAQGINFSSSTGFGGTSSQPSNKPSVFQTLAGNPVPFGTNPSVSASAPVFKKQGNGPNDAEMARKAAQAEAQKQASAAAEAEIARKMAEESARQQAEAAARAEAEQRRQAEEAEARRAAEQAAKHRAAEEAKHRREMQAREAAQKERLAQEEASRIAARRATERAATLDTLAHTAVTQPNDGFLEQFIQFLVAPMIDKERTAHLERKAIARVEQLHKKQLARKFAQKWRAIYWRRKAEREGKARRQRMRDAARQRREEEQLRVSRQKDDDRVAVNVSASQKTPPGRAAAVQSAATMPPPPRPDASDLRRSMGQSHQRQERNHHTWSKSSAERLKHSQRSTTAVITGRTDKTTSNYFKLQSLGILPQDVPTTHGPASTSPPTSSKRSHEEYVRDQPQSPMAPPQTSVGTEPPSKRLAGDLSGSRDNARLSTADLIAQSNRMLSDMAETSDWFRDETDRMTRESAVTSRRSSVNGSIAGFANGRNDFRDSLAKAFGSPAPGSIASQSSRIQEPLKYRGRTSKFLARDQYADARLQSGRGMQASSRASSRVRGASSAQPIGNEAMRAADTALEQFQQFQMLKAGPLNGSNALSESASFQPQGTQSMEIDSNNLVSSTPPRQDTAPASSAVTSFQMSAAQPRATTSPFLSKNSISDAAASRKQSANGAIINTGSSPLFGLEDYHRATPQVREEHKRDEGQNHTRNNESNRIQKEKPQRKADVPSNFNRFALLGGDGDDEDTDEDGGEDLDDGNQSEQMVVDNADAEDDESVGFSEAEETAHGQGNDFGTEDDFSDEYEYDDEEDDEGGQETTPAPGPLIDGKGGTSIEDAIEL